MRSKKSTHVETRYCSPMRMTILALLAACCLLVNSGCGGSSGSSSSSSGPGGTNNNPQLTYTSDSVALADGQTGVLDVFVQPGGSASGSFAIAPLTSASTRSVKRPNDQSTLPLYGVVMTGTVVNGAMNFTSISSISPVYTVTGTLPTGSATGQIQISESGETFSGTITAPSSSTDAALAGTYAVTSITNSQNQSSSCPSTLANSSPCYAGDSFTFNANGTGSIAYNGVPQYETFTYTSISDFISVNTGVNDAADVYYVTQTGSTLTLVLVSTGNTALVSALGQTYTTTRSS